MLPPNTLHVITHKSWIAEEFENSNYVKTKKHFKFIKHSLGFSIPKLDRYSSAWWMPTETAARFHRAGVDLNLATVPANWLPRFSMDALGREIFDCTIQQAIESGVKSHRFCKLAEVKIPEFPAQWIEVDYFAEMLIQAGVPRETKVQLSSRFLDIVSEYRCFVVDGEVTAVSTYINRGSIFGQPDFKRDHRGEKLAANAANLALRYRPEQPIAYTLDMAKLSNDRLVVLEANPVWASNPYDCDMSEVVKAVIAGSTSHNNERTHGKFQWVPDPYLISYARKKPLLPIDTY